MYVKKYRIAFMTLGCKVNQYETGMLIRKFEAAGYTIVPFDAAADIYVVNTCTVTNIADRKSRKMLHRARRQNDKAVVVCMGCFADAAGSVLKEDDGIDIIIGNKDKENAYDIIAAYVKDSDAKADVENACMCTDGKCSDISNSAADDACAKSADVHSADACNEHTRAYIKVQDGCNQFCTYCKIPYVRGKLKSRSKEDVYEEACALARRGYREIVITGIHVSSYGVDMTEHKSFTELKGEPLYELVLMLSDIPGIERIRLGSLEPRIITEEFVKGISGIEKLCPHFHLSLQSGCDTVLSRMKRKYTTEEYGSAAELIRKYYDMPALTTDIIAGFPGETDEEFETTMKFARETGFASIHVFKYSKRDGTVAAGMDGQVDEKVKNERAARMGQLADRLRREYCRNFIGRTARCLVEEVIYIDGKRYYTGHNERYVKLAFECDGSQGQLVNTMADVIPEKITDDGIMICSYKKP